MPHHFRIGDAAESGRGRDAHAGHECENRVAHHGRERESPGQPAQQAIHQHVEIARGAGFADQLPHENEQRQHRKHVIAERLVCRRGERGERDVEAAGRQRDAGDRGDTQRDHDVDAEEDENYQRGDDSNLEADSGHGVYTPTLRAGAGSSSDGIQPISLSSRSRSMLLGSSHARRS